jgi:hypothetical protein
MPAQVDEQLIVLPFTRQLDGTEVNIGRADGANFLALPHDAVEILDDLAAGCTISEAQAQHQKRHGELADVLGLVIALEAEGFVRWAEVAADSNAHNNGKKTGSYLVRFHCARFPQTWGQRIFSWPVFLASGILVSIAIAAIVANPKILPGAGALYFSSRLGTAMLWLAPLFAFQICLHELSHMAAARARGVPVRFGISHRLWLLVLETDMSGIWTLPRRQRYLPMLAGSFVDITTASGLVLVLASAAQGWITLSSITQGVLRALLVIYFYQIIWQTFLFIRTDFYYALANLLGCKNLMIDTKMFLRNLVVRLIRRGAVRNQNAVPAHEMRFIRGYSVLWIFGRALAFYILVFVQIPLVFKYLKLIGRAVSGLLSGTAVASPTVLVPTVMSLLTFALGMYLWIRSMRSKSARAQLDT